MSEEKPVYLAAVIWRFDYPEFALFTDPQVAEEWLTKTMRCPYSGDRFDDPIIRLEDAHFLALYTTYDADGRGYIKEMQVQR